MPIPILIINHRPQQINVRRRTPSLALSDH